MRRTGFLGLLGLLGCLTTALPANAGVPECGNLRFEELSPSSCSVQVKADCNAECSKFGIYKTACATKLQTVCSTQCTATADATCEDSCTVSCKAECDSGVSITCAHNCYKECQNGKEAKCGAAADVARCNAQWDANCDSECDAKCPTVNGPCYTHCIECCGGSCTAYANVDCQTSCQDVQFEQCEQEFQADCDVSCSADGALFCNGNYMISGSQLKPCLAALAAQGFQVEVKGEITIGPDGIDSNISAGLCSYSPDSKSSLAIPFGLAALSFGWFARRRKRDAKKS